MLVVPYPLHSLQDSLFKGFVKTKEPDAENHIKIWQGWECTLAKGTKPFCTIAACIPSPHPELGCETQDSSQLIRYQTAIEALSCAKCSCAVAASFPFSPPSF